MSSKEDIISNALVRIGVPPISGAGEGGAAGIVGYNLYDPTVRAILTESRWRFAAAKRQLAQLTATPLNEFSYAYQLPSDLLLLYRVYPFEDYEIFEDKLFTNAQTVEIDYLLRPIESKWPAYFQLAIEYKLASEFALTVTNNRSLAETYELKYNAQIKKARHLDSQGRPPDPIQRSHYLEVRG